MIYANDFLARKNYGARLEPFGKVIHGAGQSSGAFTNYWSITGDTHKPCVYMSYIGLRDIPSDWASPISNDLGRYLPYFIIPQIGLSMTYDGKPEQHYEDDVAAGLMDDEIEIFIKGLEQLARPVYCRIGYEFNGVTWNGYEAQSYKKAFIRITQKIRAADLEVATVWDAAFNGDENFLAYYPGDDVVDWWGINPFSEQDLTNPMMNSFLTNAHEHSKPVMFGESTPKSVGVLDGQKSWDLWFEPYFNLIHDNSGIKMFCYINFNWADTRWPDWGDCRLEKNRIVNKLFDAELDEDTYAHAQPESDFRRLVSYENTAAPSRIQNVSILESQQKLTWQEVPDPSGLSHYIIYKNGDISGYSLLPEFYYDVLFAGENAKYHITAMNRAGNESPFSPKMSVQMPASIEKIKNGEFEQGFSNWSRQVWGGTADFEIDRHSPLSGTRCAHVRVRESTGNSWHIQLRQWIKIKKGHTYKIAYRARAYRAVTIETVLQSDHEPYETYGHFKTGLTKNSRSYEHTVKARADDSAFLEFMLGKTGKADVWIDAVSVTETAPNVSAVNENSVKNSQFLLNSALPNPFNENTVFSYTLKETSELKLQIFNIQGRRIRTLFNGTRQPGFHSSMWDGRAQNGMLQASGMYIVSIASRTQTAIRREYRKILLLR
ncbi:carbohydrate binding domain-containing protein [candidate division KSB1 bacterium]|nr:carbohydrate binding domain-containing protein [candidate division KSB1 bacterium]